MTENMPVPTGKGGNEGMVMVSAGKGHRRLAGVDKTENAEVLPLLAHLAKAGKVVAAGHLVAGGAMAAAAAPVVSGAVMSSGKGAVVNTAPQTDVQCNDVSAAGGRRFAWVHARLQAHMLTGLCLAHEIPQPPVCCNCAKAQLSACHPSPSMMHQHVWVVGSQPKFAAGAAGVQ